MSWNHQSNIRICMKSRNIKKKKKKKEFFQSCWSMSILMRIRTILENFNKIFWLFPFYWSKIFRNEMKMLRLVSLFEKICEFMWFSIFLLLFRYLDRIRKFLQIRAAKKCGSSGSGSTTLGRLLRNPACPVNSTV